MSANPKVIDISQRSGISTAPLAGSEKVYVRGSRDDIRVPFREINKDRVRVRKKRPLLGVSQ